MRKTLTRFVYIWMLCWAFAGGMRAQEIPSQPTAQLITKFSFHLFSGGVVMVRACLNNIPDTLNFILDTGSGGISLDSTTCEEYQIPTQQTERMIRGIAGSWKLRYHFGGTLRFPGLTVDSLDFHVNNYELLTSVYGVKIDGIIGYSFLRRYIVRLLYETQMMEVYTQGDYKYRRGGHLIRVTMPTGIPIDEYRVKDNRQVHGRFYLDTGAGLCLLLSNDFNADSNVVSRKRKPVLTQAEGLGGKAEMRLTVVKEFKLGPYKFRNVPTFLFEDNYNVTSYPYLGGLVGNDLLRRFDVTFNYGRREIYLMPNSHYNDAFDYAYTGMAIYYVDGKIRVEDVVKGSPADKAGFRSGDIIMAINNNFSNNIQVYKTLLQTVSARLRILVIRDEGQAEIILLKPASILRSRGLPDS